MIPKFNPSILSYDNNRAWIPGYEGFYCADRDGHIYSVGSSRRKWHENEMKQMSPSDNNHRYLTIHLSIGAHRDFTIQSLMAMAWLGLEIDDLGRASILVVNHIDGDKHNNSLDNLEIISRRENLRKRDMTAYGCPRKSKRKPLMATNAKTGAVDYYPSGRDASLALHGDGKYAPMISFAATGRLKTAYGYKWKFIDWSTYEQMTGDYDYKD